MLKLHYPPASADLRRHRVEEFRCITQQEIDQLRLVCQRHLHDADGKAFDPPLVDDAFSHALAAAYQHFDGRIPLGHYILRCAKNYCLVESRRWDVRHSTQFADFAGHEDGDPILPSLIEAIADPTDYFVHLEEESTLAWAEQVSSVLVREENDKSLSKSSRVKARRARLVLQLLRNNVMRDNGIGADPVQRKKLEMDLARWIAETDGKLYFCSKCRKSHNSHVGIGKAHLRYAFARAFESKRGEISTKTIQVAMTHLRRKIEEALPNGLLQPS